MNRERAEEIAGWEDALPEVHELAQDWLHLSAKVDEATVKVLALEKSAKAYAHQYEADEETIRELRADRDRLAIEAAGQHKRADDMEKELARAVKLEESIWVMYSDQHQRERRAAWVAFAAGMFAASWDTDKAARRADEMLGEYDARFPKVTP